MVMIQLKTTIYKSNRKNAKVVCSKTINLYVEGSNESDGECKLKNMLTDDNRQELHGMIQQFMTCDTVLEFVFYNQYYGHASRLVKRMQTCDNDIYLGLRNMCMMTNAVAKAMTHPKYQMGGM